ncbi:MAG: hypothetical protein IPM64_14825 [Phycisphaerales bacterium]|nr:hypothetical protein [Phycisphaerales bacterium]
MKRILAAFTMTAVAVSANAAPMVPNILAHDWAVGAFNADGTAEYSTNGVAPDTLTYTRSTANGEVVGYWPTWPSPAAFPVLDLAGFFGGDFAMSVLFDAQDAPYVGTPSTLDVSLTGTGANELGNDLELWGRVSAGGAPPAGLMWGMEIERVSLYGYSHWDALIFEAVGTITGGSLADLFGVTGFTGVVRGSIDFLFGDSAGGIIPNFFRPEYDPSDDILVDVRAGFSGEVGEGVVIPEPMTAGMLLLAAAALARRR